MIQILFFQNWRGRTKIIPLILLFIALTSSLVHAAESRLELAATQNLLNELNNAEIVVNLDGKVAGILPTSLMLDQSKSHELVLYTLTGYQFNYRIEAGSQLLKIIEALPTHSGPERAKVVTQGISPKEFKASFDYYKAGDWECGMSPATGADEGKILLAFTSTPKGAKVYYPSGNTFLVSTTPVQMAVPFSSTAHFSVIFKLHNYFDCVVTLSFSQDHGTRVLEIGGRKISVQPATVAGAEATDVTCNHRPMRAPK